MTRFSQLMNDPASKSIVLASDQIDASNVFFARTDKKSLSLVQQTLIIGLGGSGIKTVNRIKGKLKQTYDLSACASKLAFLAIDTDKGDLEGLAFLEDNEKYLMEDAGGIGPRHNVPLAGHPDTRSAFVKSWIYPNFQENFSSAGANANRAVCHVKMFDYVAGQAADEKIERAIQESITDFTTSDPIEVIIILGVAGGTGSGGLINIAHFVRNVLRKTGKNARAKITGYFFMPDVFSEKNYDATKKANGYAALKELDYYHCTIQRLTEDALVDGFNGYNTGCSTKISKDNPLYNTAFLISGSVAGAMAHPYETALSAATESIVNLLTENQTDAAAAATAAGVEPVFLMSSFRANEDQDRRSVLNTEVFAAGVEQPNYYAEDVYKYNAIGVGTAAIPNELLKGYMVNRIVRGIVTTDMKDGEWNTHIFTSEAGKNEAKLLLKGVTPEDISKTIVRIVDEMVCRDAEEFQTTRKNITEGTANAELNNDLHTGEQTKSACLKAINGEIDQAFIRFKENLTLFIKEHGPTTFKALYYGTDNADGGYTGIARTLDGYLAMDRDKCKMKPDNQKELQDAFDEVKRFWTAVKTVVGNSSDITAWVKAYKADAVAKIAYKIGDDVLKKEGEYTTRFIERARNLCERCVDFADALEAVCDVYRNLAYTLDSHDHYRAWLLEQNSSRRFDCIQTKDAYDWMLATGESKISGTDYVRIRNRLVDDFIENPKAWTECDANEPGKGPRTAFDRIIAPVVRRVNIDVVEYITYAAGKGTANVNSVVKELVDELVKKSTPLFAADSRVNMTTHCHRYLVAPKGALSDATVKAAFTAECAKNAVEIKETDAATEFAMYTMRGGLPIYAVNGIVNEGWEKEYLTQTKNDRRLHRNESGAGDFDPVTGLAWADYPPLTHGNHADDGYMKNQFNPLFADALAKGVIKEQQDVAGKYYYVFRNLVLYNLDLDFDVNDPNWTVDADGLLAKDDDMFAYLAERGGKTLNDITQNVVLQDQGAFSLPNADRAVALDWAKRSLRKNVPMFLQVKKTLAAVNALWPQIDKENEIRKVEIAKKLEEEKKQKAWQKAVELAPKCIACEVLLQKSSGSKSWVMLDNSGKTTSVATTDALMLKNKNGVLNQKRILQGLTYPALVDQLKQFILSNDTSKYEVLADKLWSAMITSAENDDTAMRSKFKKKLEDTFVSEANSFKNKYDGPSNLTARMELINTLKHDDYDVLSDCYNELLMQHEML